MTDTTADPQAYDGCRRACRQARAHTLISGECEHATEPEPTVSLSRVYTATDGHPAIGFDVYTEEQVADLIQPAVGSAAVARAAAHAIVHRHDEPKPAPAAVSSAPVDRAAVLREAADALVAVAGQHPEARAVVIHWGDAAALLRTMAQEECDELEAQAHLDEIADGPSRMADEAQQPTSTAPLAANLPLVQGRCPACNGASLFLGDGGYVTCSRIDCPEPDAASTALEQPAAEAQQPENPARIDRLRPEFTDHASVESIDAQLQRARSQLRRWHLRVEWLISLRQARLEQKERGEWPAAVPQPAEVRQADTAGEQQ